MAGKGHYWAFMYSYDIYIWNNSNYINCNQFTNVKGTVGNSQGVRMRKKLRTNALEYESIMRAHLLPHLLDVLVAWCFITSTDCLFLVYLFQWFISDNKLPRKIEHFDKINNRHALNCYLQNEKLIRLTEHTVYNIKFGKHTVYL
jgi:hypothetical protein